MANIVKFWVYFFLQTSIRFTVQDYAKLSGHHHYVHQVRGEGKTPVTYKQLRRAIEEQVEGTSKNLDELVIPSTSLATTSTTLLIPSPMLTEKTEFWKERRKRRRINLKYDSKGHNTSDYICIPDRKGQICQWLKHSPTSRHTHLPVRSKRGHPTTVVNHSPVGRKVCERIMVPMCQGMPYNVTKMPNYFHEATQQNVRLVMDRYKLLVRLRNNCSSILTFFLCSLHVPMCDTEFFGPDNSHISRRYLDRQGENLGSLPTLGFLPIEDADGSKERVALIKDEHPSAALDLDDGRDSGLTMILPCQHVCTQARSSCEPLLMRFNESWPKELECNRFPSYKRGICISPQAIVKDSVATPSQFSQLPLAHEGSFDKVRKVKQVHGASNKTHVCRCSHPPKLKQKYFYHRRYNYGLKIDLFKIENLDGIIILKAKIRDVLLQSSIKLSKGQEVSIWIVSSCMCPKFKINKEYLILGHEDPDIQALLYSNKKGIALPWKNRMKVKVELWARRMKEKIMHEKLHNNGRNPKFRGAKK